jgi:DNA polymerase-4
MQEQAERCRACGSPRLIAHAERDSLAIAHVDCDAFYATIEKRDDPSLRAKPVIIGGGRRGVVSTCCYVARTYGVRSAMPMFKALAACPGAVVIRPDMAKYTAVAREVRQLMKELTPLVEPLSIDEAFLDLTGTEQLHGGPPALTLARFARAVEQEIGITVSVGLAPNKFLAKIASDRDKPRGFSIIGRAEAMSFLAPQPIGLIWGIGKVTERRLNAAGIHVISDLLPLDDAALLRVAGNDGPRLKRLARGIDERPVNPVRETKSISSETTFDSDLADEATLVPILWTLAERVSARAKESTLAGSIVTLKMKTKDFQIRTRSRALPEPTQLALRIFETARDLMLPELGGATYRLIGVGLSGLTAPDAADRGDLINQTARRDVATERAIDSLRAKFGDRAIARGIGLGREAASRPRKQ